MENVQVEEVLYLACFQAIAFYETKKEVRGLVGCELVTLWLKRVVYVNTAVGGKKSFSAAAVPLAVDPQQSARAALRWMLDATLHPEATACM